ncbi:MAG: DUF4351 domain-containing protein [Moorea sp. SIOASIH]|uniref:DUF4351 domain-containing protein n=1 Tax=Moorena sp. SIOASIH TaxID=2607817 RepID=UPI0013B8507B|nr:DUF4351 domain-containing protein [Moorena sp. SIOASIH]NEO39391.1 DUF4351 domain-containing protein [Moorena sp. SIOASIH]
MEESVTYQDIIQKGRQRGKQEGVLLVVMRLLTLRLGLIDPVLQQKIEELSITRLEELSEALLDFETVTDLAVWLDNC